VKDPEKVLKENPGSVIFARYAEKLALEGKIVEALEILNNGIETNPYYAPGYSVLADIYSMQGSQKKSVEQLEKALSMNPQAPRDMLNLGKYLINDQPERAKDYYRAAHRYEPEVSEEALLPEDELTMAPDEEDEFAELVAEIGSPEETEKGIEESTVVEESVMEETQEDTEISLETEADEIQPIEATEPEELHGEETIKEPGETIPGEGISDDLDLMPDTEEVLEELGKEAEIPEETEEGVEESTVMEESVMEETQEDTEISLETETDEIKPIEPTETEELPEEEDYTEDEENITGEISSDIKDLIGNTQTTEEELFEDLEQPLENEEEKTTVEEEKTFDEIDEEEIPGYSEMLEGGEPMGLDSLDNEQEKSDILEIEGDEEYDVSKLEYDLSAGEIEEPVLTEEERAELLALEESSQDVDKDIEIEEYGAAQIKDSDLTGLVEEPEIEMEESDETLPENLYGDLSEGEIDVLSVADTEPDDAGKDLETETREGIDYSDILYGQESVVESEEISEDVLVEEIQPEEELETETGIEDVSPPETKDENSKDNLVDTEDVLAEDRDKYATIDEASESEITLGEEQEIESGESGPESETSDLSTNDDKIAEDMVNDIKYFELSLTEQDIQDVENSSLNEVIDNYVGALKDYSEEPEEEKIDYSEGDKSPESLTEYKDVELEMSGDKFFDGEAGEDITNTAEDNATMAEIFVSQGLITRAVDIYKVLLEREPDNENIKSRLEELGEMLDE